MIETRLHPATVKQNGVFYTFVQFSLTLWERVNILHKLSIKYYYRKNVADITVCPARHDNEVTPSRSSSKPI